MTDTRDSAILLLTENFPPTPGGTARWFSNIYSRLGRRTIVLTRQNEAIPFPHLDVRHIEWTIKDWSLLNLASWKNYWCLTNQVMRVVREERIHQLHVARCLPEGVVAYFLRRVTMLPYLVYVHGEDIEIAWRSREFRCVVRQVLTAATKLIANSRFTAELLVTKWKVARSRVRVLHPGVDTHYFTPIPMKRVTDGYTILCPGRLQKRKGQDVLLQAAAFLRDKIPCLRVIIAGDGPDSSATLSLINELHLSNRVMWIRNPSDDELVALYSVSDIVVLPNRTIDGDCEGFGIVLLEAQACGKPVICGNCGGTKETLLPGRSGLVIDCTQPYSLANTLLTLYRRKHLLAQMGRQGRCWVTRMFDWSVLVPKAQQLLAI